LTAAPIINTAMVGLYNFIVMHTYDPLTIRG